MAVEPSWDAVHTDATWHATYWIAEWPRVDVTPDFLGPLLFSPLRRSISLVMEPMSPSRAARQVAQARTADLADGELRRRGGFLVTARHTREKESVEERDVELADGHAQYPILGVRDGDRRYPRRARRRLCRRGAGRRPGRDRAPAPLRRAGCRPSPAPFRWAGGCREGHRSPGAGPRGHYPASLRGLSPGERGRPRSRRGAHREGRARWLLRLRPVRPLSGGAWSPIPTWWCSGRSDGGRAPSSSRTSGARPSSGAMPG